MFSSERRNADRYKFNNNYPILLTEESTPTERIHLAQVLDAGKDGIRLLLAGSNPLLQIGSELNLSCSPARDTEKTKESQPVRFRCKVAWQDLENNQIGLTYIQ